MQVPDSHDPAMRAPSHLPLFVVSECLGSAVVLLAFIWLFRFDHGSFGRLSGVWPIVPFVMAIPVSIIALIIGAPCRGFRSSRRRAFGWGLALGCVLPFFVFFGLQMILGVC